VLNGVAVLQCIYQRRWRPRHWESFVKDVSQSAARAASPPDRQFQRPVQSGWSWVSGVRADPGAIGRNLARQTSQSGMAPANSSIRWNDSRKVLGVAAIQGVLVILWMKSPVQATRAWSATVAPGLCKEVCKEPDGKGAKFRNRECCCTNDFLMRTAGESALGNPRWLASVHDGRSLTPSATPGVWKRGKPEPRW
jgi:hypothetical protein